MEYIKSKDMCILIRDTLALIDKRIIEHGSRTAYILSRMLACRGGYEQYEIADLAILAILHDFGAYKTDNVHEMMRVELQDPMPHSIYGYLFFRYLSPHPEYARILLYHHLDYNQTKDLEDEYIELARHLNLAEKVEIYHSALENDFSAAMLSKDIGTRYGEESFRLLEEAVRQYDIIAKLTDGSYAQELDGILDYVLLSDEEKVGYLNMLMYCIGFRSEYAVIDSVTCICVCKEIGKLCGLRDDEQELLYYSALLHDIGMLSVPRKIIQSKEHLEPEQLAVLQKHVLCAREILLGRINQDVVDIVYTHHERLDGSGYPVGKKTGPMTALQRILQIADLITSLTNEWSYDTVRRKDGTLRQIKDEAITLEQNTENEAVIMQSDTKNSAIDALRQATKEKTISVLEEEARAGRLDRRIVDSFIKAYDMIMREVRKESKEILKMHTKLHRQYRLVYHKLKK